MKQIERKSMRRLFVAVFGICILLFFGWLVLRNLSLETDILVEKASGADKKEPEEDAAWSANEPMAETILALNALCAEGKLPFASSEPNLKTTADIQKLFENGKEIVEEETADSATAFWQPVSEISFFYDVYEELAAAGITAFAQASCPHLHTGEERSWISYETVTPYLQVARCREDGYLEWFRLDYARAPFVEALEQAGFTGLKDWLSYLRECGTEENPAEQEVAVPIYAPGQLYLNRGMIYAADGYFSITFYRADFRLRPSLQERIEEKVKDVWYVTKMHTGGPLSMLELQMDQEDRSSGEGKPPARYSKKIMRVYYDEEEQVTAIRFYLFPPDGAAGAQEQKKARCFTDYDTETPVSFLAELGISRDRAEEFLKSLEYGEQKEGTLENVHYLLENGELTVW